MAEYIVLTGYTGRIPASKFEVADGIPVIGPDSTTLSGRPWLSVVGGQRRRVALAVARGVAARIVDRGHIAEAFAAGHYRTQYPDSTSWRPFAVAGGDAGIAVVCSYLDQCPPKEGWDAIGHSFLVTGARAVERIPQLHCGFFSGLSGLAFAVASLSYGGLRYQRLSTVLDETLAPQASSMATRLRSSSAGVAVGEFDVVSGLSGIGAYLLRQDPSEVQSAVLESLVWLAEPIEPVPRWATPPELQTDESMRRSLPLGSLNCGLAHGIPGPLALLALALIGGQHVSGQAEAIRGLAEWLVAHRVDDEWGINWSSAIPLAPMGAHTPMTREVAPARSAWCYGGPGVARALWLAGEALGGGSLRQLALDAILSVLRRPIELRYIGSPTFCHGVAGLLQIVLRFSHDIGIGALIDGADELVGQLLGAYDPTRPLGYASLEPENNLVDRAGSFEGAPGVALTLLAAATDTEPTWDRLFLLS